MTEQIEQFMQWFMSDNPGRRTKLYGLASLRSIDDQEMLAEVMGLSISSLKRSLQQLYRDYPSIFTDASLEQLNPDIRVSLRKSLLEQRNAPEELKLLLTLCDQQRQRFQRLEQELFAADWRTHLSDELWGEQGLDLLEAQLWVDPGTGSALALAFVLLTSLYLPDRIPTIVAMRTFFEQEIEGPQRERWFEVCQGFQPLEQAFQPQEKLEALQKIKKRIKQEQYFIMPPFEQYQQPLLAALEWQTGELYSEINMLSDAANHYLAALPTLYAEELLPIYTARLYQMLADAIPDEPSPGTDFLLKKTFLLKVIAYQSDVADNYYDLGNVYFKLHDYQTAITYYQYAIELEPHFFQAWHNLGVTYTKLKKYQRALDELNYAEQFNTECADFYFSRGNVYRELHQYDKALQDFNHAIELNPAYADAYTNRGNIHAMFNRPEQALQDYEQTLHFKPDDILARYLREWICFGKQKVSRTTLVKQRLLEIAAVQPHHYLATVCTGIAYGFTLQATKQAVIALEQSCQEAPDDWDGYFWLTLAAAYYNRTDVAETALHHAIERDVPTALLYPLFWLEKDRPNFFQKKVLPLLQKQSRYAAIL